MGHSQAEKARTHARIVETASALFRARGLDGIGVADLMKAAGATAGGFYKHFPSRDALVAEAMAAAFGGWAQRIEAAETRPSLAEVAEDYLSRRHCADPGSGCPVAALAPDLARADAGTRALATEKMKQAVEILTGIVGNGIGGGADGPAARAEAIFAYAAMVGALSLARIAEGQDDAFADEILATVRSRLARGN